MLFQKLYRLLCSFRNYCIKNEIPSVSLTKTTELQDVASMETPRQAEQPQHYAHRLLASEYTELRIDYSVLAVLVMTLGLIMIVEVIRHRLDAAAKSRPFLQSVLEGVYTELTTLGIVELFIWLLHSYYEDLDVAKEVVFAQVHFTLFYTAIFNAFQTALVAFFSIRVSRHVWVRTETLELNHYVEIREEFDRVQEQMRKDTHQKRTDSSPFRNDPPENASTTAAAAADQENDKQETLEGKEVENIEQKVPKRNVHNSGSTHRSCKRLTSSQHDGASFRDSMTSLLRTGRQNSRRRLANMCSCIRHPYLHHRYHQLLVQIRFHELRVHLLHAYQLPTKMRVSDYLMSCELAVLIKLVHVSTVAWLFLTSVSNLLYFTLGIVSYETEDVGVISTSLEFIFFLSMAGFVLIALSLHAKMRHAFDDMMHSPTLWDMNHTDDEKKKLAAAQLELFWFGSPKLVIAAVQFMQFGYALALSIILIFWDDIAAGTIDMKWYILANFITYAIFVWVVAKVIPRYTLCTCLGQLVNHRNLHKTVSLFRLEDAKRQRLENIALNEAVTFENTTIVNWSNSQELAYDANRPKGNVQKESILLLPVIKSEASKLDLSTLTKDKSKSQLMVDLVKVDTSMLRSYLPKTDQVGLIRREKDRDRIRSISDGVSLMCQIQSDELNPLGASTIQETSNAHTRRPRTQRLKSISDGVALMSVLSKDSDDVTLLRMGNSKILSRRGASQSRNLTPVDLTMVTSHTDTLRSLLPESERNILEENEYENYSNSKQILPDIFRRGDSGLGRTLKQPRSTRDDLFMCRANVSGDTTNDAEEIVTAFDTTPESLRRRRRNNRHRHKSVSDGVALMAHVQSAELRSTRGSSFSLTSTHPSAMRAFPPSSRVSLETSRILPDVDVSKDLIRESNSIHVEDHGVPQPDVQTPIPVKNNENSIVSTNTSCNDVDYSSDGSIPDVDPDVFVAIVALPKKPTLLDSGRYYYLSKKYVLLSNVFGTMVVFFFVGQRIESFLSSEGLTDSEVFVSFDFPNKINFWVIFVWLLMFLTTSILIIILFGRISIVTDRHERALVLSAWIDGVLTVFCFVMFCVAEVQRCCYSTDNGQESLRKIAGIYDPEGTNAAYPSGEPAPCSCPPFGSRTYGGLGSLEPYIAMIALRLLRHIGARQCVHYWDSRFSAKHVSSEHQETSESNTRAGMSPFSVFNDENTTKDMKHENGSIVELWQSAVEQNPDIVRTYGEFSGELLQTMLGVPLVSGKSLPYALSSPEIMDSAVANADVTRFDRWDLSIDDKYSSLEPHAQEVIVAGRIGKPVKSTIDSAFAKTDQTRGDQSLDLNGKLLFQVDLDRPKSDKGDSMFLMPNARLVRSMRRGDRKLLPILRNWSVVDVVLTKFELVYFDATDCDGSSEGETQDVKEAIVATRGGKGIRLSDVAVGRRVAGHLEFSEIEAIVVERELPFLNAIHPHDHDAPSMNVSKNEYWQNHATDVDSNRTELWRKTKQDVLKIHSKGGRSLQIRFYSDLADSEAHPDRVRAENEIEGPIFRNIAFKWAQTLVRLCGPDQLRQVLPHFGDNTSDELRDFLHVKKFASHLRLAGMDLIGIPRNVSQRLPPVTVNESNGSPSPAIPAPSPGAAVHYTSTGSNAVADRKPILKRLSSLGEMSRSNTQSSPSKLFTVKSISTSHVGSFNLNEVASAMSSVETGSLLSRSQPMSTANETDVI